MAPKLQTPARPPRWYLIPVRVLLVTFIVTLISFAISLLIGILGTVLVAKLRGMQLDMTFAYRYVALPVTATVGPIVFVSACFMEGRHYRQAKALAQIERAG
jgi:hypothetical protein